MFYNIGHLLMDTQHIHALCSVPSPAMQHSAVPILAGYIAMQCIIDLIWPIPKISPSRGYECSTSEYKLHHSSPERILSNDHDTHSLCVQPVVAFQRVLHIHLVIPIQSIVPVDIIQICKHYKLRRVQPKCRQQ